MSNSPSITSTSHSLRKIILISDGGPLLCQVVGLLQMDGYNVAVISTTDVDYRALDDCIRRSRTSLCLRDLTISLASCAETASSESTERWPHLESMTYTCVTYRKTGTGSSRRTPAFRNRNHMRV